MKQFQPMKLFHLDFHGKFSQRGNYALLSLQYHNLKNTEKFAPSLTFPLQSRGVSLQLSLNSLSNIYDGASFAKIINSF